MACLDEFTCAVYADGELPEKEARQAREHLETCAACRQLVEALRLECRVLIQCLQELEAPERELEPAAAPGAELVGLGRLGAVVMGIAAALRVVWEFVGNFGLPSNLDWLDPMRTSGQLTLLLNAIVYVFPEGGSTMESILNRASFAALTVLVLIAMIMLFRRSMATNAVLGVIAILTVFSTSGQAIDVRQSRQTLNVPAGETVDDTLVVFGDSVNVDGTVNGDLIAFVRRISVRGTVKGNVIAFAQRVDNEGSVEGTVIGVGQSVQTRGQIARNLFGVAQDAGIGNGARVAGNAILFSAVTNIEGNIGRDLTAYSGRLDLHGNVERNVLVRSDQVNVFAPSHIGGNLTATVRKTENVHVDTGSTIGGKTDIRVREPRPSKYATASFYVWQAIWFAAAFITGLAVFWLAPALARVSLDSGRALLMAAGVGFLALVVPPMAAIVAGITLIGLPIGLLTLALWITAAYMAKIVIAAFLGRSLLGGQGLEQPSFALVLLAGLLPIFIAINLPFIGGVIDFLLILLGLGALVTAIYRTSPWRSAQV
ncbi:MAG: hypothetical protein DMG13_15345 [Acidobacteria bacterium]|nr:MAG: hypothetical protein DMG13_15345 [Acidobacteriota bacterium]